MSSSASKSDSAVSWLQGVASLKDKDKNKTRDTASSRKRVASPRASVTTTKRSQPFGIQPSPKSPSISAAPLTAHTFDWHKNLAAFEKNLENNRLQSPELLAWYAAQKRDLLTPSQRVLMDKMEERQTARFNAQVWGMHHEMLKDCLDKVQPVPVELQTWWQAQKNATLTAEQKRLFKARQLQWRALI